MTDEEVIARGRTAQRILNEPLYVESFDACERNLIDEMAKAGTPAARAEYLRTVLIGLRSSKRYLTGAVADGNYSASRAKEDEERRKWWRPAA